MTTLLKLYETEQGDDVTITGKEADGTTNANLSWAVEGDSIIEIKDSDDVIILTLTGTTDFTLADPVFSWTPTDAQVVLLTAGTTYTGFIHARNNGTPRERVLVFSLKLLDS